MHPGNIEWLTELKGQHTEFFVRARVLEIGSCDSSGTVRRLFDDCDYVGVDKVPGPGVDLVCEASATEFGDRRFDTLVVLSVFEHDPTWRETLAHNLAWVRPGGLVMLCWGAEGNRPHPPEPWAIVPVADFMAFAATLPLEILEAFVEDDRYQTHQPCPGAYDVLARRL